MQGWAYVIVLAGISLWVAPFILAKRHPELTSQIDKRARWGILLEMFSFAVLWQGKILGTCGSGMAGRMFSFVFRRGGGAVVDVGTRLGNAVAHRCRPERGT